MAWDITHGDASLVAIFCGLRSRKLGSRTELCLVDYFRASSDSIFLMLSINTGNTFTACEEHVAKERAFPCCTPATPTPFLAELKTCLEWIIFPSTVRFFYQSYGLHSRVFRPTAIKLCTIGNSINGHSISKGCGFMSLLRCAGRGHL
jgi:hypothetical protein